MTSREPYTCRDRDCREKEAQGKVCVWCWGGFERKEKRGMTKLILFCWECAPIVGAIVQRHDLDDARYSCARCEKRNYSVKYEKPGQNDPK